MKKLLFATALVATAAAFADGEPTALNNAISFEGYTAGVLLPANGVAEMNEDGQSDKQAAYFLYDGDADGSTVKAFGGENAAAPSITRPFYFASGSAGANYLDLSTEGGILWRSIAAITNPGTGYELGGGRQLVQKVFIWTRSCSSRPPKMVARRPLNPRTSWPSGSMLIRVLLRP